MKLVIAPDSFKESLDAESVAHAIAKGIESTMMDVEIHCVPVADGGEGTTEALIAATSGQLHSAETTGPLGQPIKAIWGVLGDQAGVPLTAVIETAAASGLDKILPEQRDALMASTYGTGELILKALDKGARRIIMGLGGSATNDGGMGLLKALGAKFLDASGDEIAEGGAALANLDRIDLAGFDSRLAETEFLVACDVDNPLLGDRGASAIFGPQKGATPSQLQQLDKALARLADISAELLGKDFRDREGAGAAGGLGYALVQFLGARLAPGIDLVLEAVDFHKTLEGADLVITGEGQIDGQSLSGKTPVGVARWAKQHNLPVIALCGSIREGAEGVHDVGIDALFSVVPGVCSLEEALANGAENLERTGAQLGRLLSLKTTQL